MIVLATATGGLTADALIYFLTRSKGDLMVDIACGLTSNPTACVLSVSRKLERAGDRYILFGKFLPGIGNLIARASALAGVPPGRFLSRDAVALLLWASAYTALGWVFADKVKPLLAWAVRSVDIVLAVGIALIVGAGLWRVIRVRLHTKEHGRTRTAPEPD